MPKVSVVVPIYNVEKYLSQCVDSVLNQTYKDIEIILVDDESPDKCGFICDEYAKKDSRIKVIHKKNGGLGFARNSGLEAATGKYVMFIDSDDYFDPDGIEKLVMTAEEHNADVVIAGFKKVNDNGEVLFCDKYEPFVCSGEDVKNKVFMRMLGSSPQKKDAIKMSVCSTLYSLDIIKKNNLNFFSERQFISEDLIFNSDFMPLAQKAVVTDFTPYKYRFNQSSLTTTYRPDRMKKCLYLYIEMKHRLEKLDMPEEALSRLQRQFFVNLRSVLRHEAPRYSGNSWTLSYIHIKKICNAKIIRNIISTYPKKYLGLKQRVFLELIYRRMYFIIEMLAQLKIF